MKKVYDKPQIGLKHFKFIDRTNNVSVQSTVSAASLQDIGAEAYTRITPLAKSLS